MLYYNKVRLHVIKCLPNFISELKTLMCLEVLDAQIFDNINVLPMVQFPFPNSAFFPHRPAPPKKESFCFQDRRD